MSKEKSLFFRCITVFALCISLLVTGIVLNSSETAAFHISKPGKVKIRSVTSKAQSVAKVKWKKTKCSGYQVEAATDRLFRINYRIVNVKRTKKVIFIKKLKKGTRYYFRVRAYNKAGNLIRYGKWSKIKSRIVHKHKFILVKWDVYGKHYKCKCGKTRLQKNELNSRAVLLMNMPNNFKPTITPEKATKNKEDVVVTAVDSRGFTYNYRLFYQTAASLNKSSTYLKNYGCSTCALTTILRETVPEFSEYTPNQVLKSVIKKVAASEGYKTSLRNSNNKTMPIGLNGISKVLTAYGVKHKYVFKFTAASAKAELKRHLSHGDPVIFYSKGKLYTQGGEAHAMLLLGLDAKGNAIFGDSLKQKKLWGSNNYGLLKYGQEKNPNSNSLDNVVKYMHPTSNNKTNEFYSCKYGYILINNQ